MRGIQGLTGDEHGVVVTTVGTDRAEKTDTRWSFRSSEHIASVRTSESSTESAERTRNAE